MNSKKTFNLYRLTRSDIWDQGLVSLYKDKERSVINYLREPKFNVKDANTTYRLIHTWSKDGLLDDNRPEGDNSWRRLSIIEIIWIRVLNELRKYGVAKNKLRESFRTAFKLYPDNNDASLFEVAICLVLQKRSVKLIVFDDGWLEPLLDEENTLNIVLQLHNSYLQINLNKLIQEAFPKTKRPDLNIPIYLNDSEAELVALLNEKNLKKVSIKLKNGKVSSLDKYFELKNINDATELLEKIQFGELQVKKRHGKLCFYEVVEKNLY